MRRFLSLVLFLWPACQWLCRCLVCGHRWTAKTLDDCKKCPKCAKEAAKDGNGRT